MEGNTSECPGEGKCHDCMKWCDNCGDVAHVCDTRLRSERCDEHPVPPSVGVIRTARRMAEKMIVDGRALAREGHRALDEAVDAENASRAYWKQMAEQEQAEMALPAGSPT